MIVKLFILPATVFILYFTACTSPEKSGSVMPEPGENYKSFTSDGAWCWFSDPRAICYKGKYYRIYAGWIDHEGNVTVGSYDLDSHEIKTHVIHSGLQEDDHDAPALFITDEASTCRELKTVCSLPSWMLSMACASWSMPTACC